jgi:phenylacetic acid degradation operon negative regulatory protein
MVRHIRTDPVLPPELLPADWPGLRLRRDYDEYRAELGRLIAGLRDE